ncbi:MAG: alpha/beta fold hydrolase [Bacteroidota bacterium]|nr:alpha/beta fold hydrolase [Bacteroidota bacterium]
MYLKIGGFGIDYSLEGPKTGLPIVFIHGFPFGKEMWKPQVEALKQDYIVVTYDLRGHGASDVGNGQYTIEYCVDDLMGLIDALKLQQVIVVGSSMGGYIALRAYERHSDRFKGLVLCNTRSDDDTNDVKIKRALQARNVKIYGMRKFANKYLPAIFYEKILFKNPDVVKMIRGIIEKTSPNAAAGMLIALAARTNSTPSLSKIEVPTLIMVGQFDEMTPPSASIAMKEKIQNAELHILPDAAHMSNLENPEEFNKHLINFLKKIE